MRMSFNELAEMRRYWIRTGHKNVPSPLCCCSYEKPGSCYYTEVRGAGSIRHYCQIHTGLYWATIRFIRLVFLFLRLNKSARMLEQKYNNVT